MDTMISGQSRIIAFGIFALYTVITLLLGAWASKSNRKAGIGKFADEFYASGRGLGAVVVGLTTGAALCSAGTFVAVPGASSVQGFSWALIVTASAMCNFLVYGIAGKKIGIISRRINAVSYIGLIRHRYDGNKFIPIFCCIAIVVFIIPYSTSQFVGGARLLENMTGLPYMWGLAIFFGVLFIYTVFGGMKGVSIAAVFQGAVMTAATLSLLIGTLIYVNKTGGYQAGFEAIAQSGDNAFMTPYHTWQATLNLLLINGIALIGQPQVVQSAFGVKNTQSIHGTILIGLFFVVIWQFSMSFIGVSSTVAGINPEVTDHTSSIMALTVLPSWLVGILIAGAMGAIQSTVGSMMIVLSSSLTKDLYLEFINKNASESAIKKVSMGTTGIGMVIAIILAINPPDLLQNIVNYAMGGLASSFFAPLLLGLVWKRANHYGGCCGIVVGLLYFLLAENIPALQLFGFPSAILAMTFSIIVVIVVSLLTPKPAYGTILTWFGKDYPKEVS